MDLQYAASLVQPDDDGQPPVRSGHALPAWRNALVVVAHPDDETFGLGAVIDALVAGGSSVHVLCFTRGEASTLNHCDADLPTVRAEELSQASAELGVSGFTLLDYPDGCLEAVPQHELQAHVADLAARWGAEGLLVFDDTGITGHRDHQVATSAAVAGATAAGLPVLAWTLSAAVAGQLAGETGASFAGRTPDEVDICLRVTRSRQRRAALLHATQISPAAVLWRRLQLQGDCEYLRWIPAGQAGAR